MISSRSHIAVVRGGPSREYTLSLETGKAILDALKDTHQVTDVFIDRSGTWHRDGREKSFHDALKNHDIIVNALHGAFGEDGNAQRFFETSGIPYTGSRGVSASFSFHKPTAKSYYQGAGLSTPRGVTIDKKDDLSVVLEDIFNSLVLPLVVKPVRAGSSAGVIYVKHYDELRDVLARLFVFYDGVMVEEYITGMSVTVAILESFRDVDRYVFVPITISPLQSMPYVDFELRHQLAMQPAHNLSKDQRNTLLEHAITAHNILGLSGYSTSDFVVSPKRGVYILETNALPSLAEATPLSTALQETGLGQKEFLTHIMNSAH